LKKNTTLLLNTIEAGCEEPFNERILFQESDEEFLDDIQRRFYNISRIMDCISCDRCRLNGKVQVRGLATAFKVLFLPDQQKQ
jgi:hypothetical protein